MDDLIRDAADLIRPFSADLAAAFIDQPFSRTDLAFAFAAGFAKDDSDDIHPTASIIIQIALADRRHRAI
tara:strand:- start:425 stop:634 length:210 start_codon:yes stop_codon:yes gene_type:complete